MNDDDSRRPRRFWFLVMGVSSLVFVAAVARQVLPVPTLSTPSESLTELQERLAEERSALRRSLQSDLEDWERKNAELEAEIEQMETETPEEE